jgi:transcriptional regulator with XRE-family HTH domain
MARPRKTLTPKQLDEVETLAAVLSQEQIADYFGMARNTFAQIMERQPEVFERYKKGRAKAISDVGGGLLMRAREGDTASAIFYLKTQAGWREKEVEQNDDAQTLNITFDVTPAAGDVKVTRGKS